MPAIIKCPVFSYLLKQLQALTRSESALHWLSEWEDLPDFKWVGRDILLSFFFFKSPKSLILFKITCSKFLLGNYSISQNLKSHGLLIFSKLDWGWGFWFSNSPPPLPQLKKNLHVQLPILTPTATSRKPCRASFPNSKKKLTRNHQS